MILGGVGLGSLCYIPLIFSTIGVIAGFMAIMRKSYAFSMAGGILGILGAVGFCWGSIMCLAGVLIVGTSKDAFEKTEMDRLQPRDKETQHHRIPPPPQPPARQGKPCPTCGDHMSYIEEEKRWYCNICQGTNKFT